MASAPRRDWRADRAAFWILIQPPVLWLAIFFVIPLGLVWLISFADRGPQGQVLAAATFDNYLRALEPIHLLIIGKSLAIAGAVTGICVAMGLPMALVIAFAPRSWRNGLLLLVMLPFWTNLLIRTYSWIAVLRTEGFVNRALAWLHDVSGTGATLFGAGDRWLEFRPVELLYNNGAIIIGLVHIHLPFVVLPLYVALEKIDRACLEASLDLGASTGQTFRLVMMPMALSGLVTGAGLTFILAMGAVVAGDLLGGTSGLMIGNLIQRQFTGANDWPFGAALSFLLLYVAFGLVWFGAAWRNQVARP